MASNAPHTSTEDGDAKDEMLTATDHATPPSPGDTSTAYLENVALNLLRNLHEHGPADSPQQVPSENHANPTKTSSASQMATIASLHGPCWSQSTVASPLDATFVPRPHRSPASQNRPQNAQINSPPKTATAAAPSITVEGPYSPPIAGMQRPLRVDPGPRSLLMRSSSLRHLTLTSPRIPRVGPESSTFFMTAEEEPHSEGESSATAQVGSRISATTRVQTRLTNQSTAVSGLRRRSPDASSISTIADAESQSLP